MTAEEKYALARSKAKDYIVHYQRVLQDYAYRIAKYQAAETLDEDDMERWKSLEFRQISARNEAAAVQEAYELAGILTDKEVMDIIIAAGPVDGKKR